MDGRLSTAGANGRLRLGRTTRNRIRGCGLDSAGSGSGPVTGYFDHGNEPSYYTKGGESLGQFNV
jgi:hypothetical protein